MRLRQIKKISKPTVMILAFLFCASNQTVLRAEEHGLIPGLSPTCPLPRELKSEEPRVNVERSEDGEYFLDFKSASLINVLNVLASLSGINFVAGKEVADRQVNMTLDRVSLEEALQAISHGCNVSYNYLPSSNIYLFRSSADEPDQPPLLTRVFKLYHVRVSTPKAIEDQSTSSSSGSGSTSGSTLGSLVTLKQEDDKKDLEGAAVYKTVEKILSKRGKVSVDDRTNSLVVTDSEDRIRMITDAIAQLDRPLDQVLINVLLVETFEDLERTVGVRWGNEKGFLGSVSGGSMETNWPFTPAKAGGTNPWDGFSNFVKSTSEQFNPGNESGKIATPGKRDFQSFSITLQALEEANKIKILAKPKILVLDNHPALIKIATNAAVGNTTYTTAEGAGSQSDSTERAEVGTILRVTPLINNRDQITMTVEPTFSTVAPSAITLATPTGDTTVRTARTTLMVNDGQTIALGGLLFSDQSKDDRKVPFFGNIPVIGKALFTNSSKTIQDRELILFLSPFIIRDPADLQTPTVPDKRLRYDDEKAPFYQMKKKEWYKRLEEGEEKQVDFENYFDVRKRLMTATLDTLDSRMEASSASR